MKKRLISLLLTVVMLVSLFSGFTISASADANVATVSLSSGDTVVGLCQKYGIDYYTYKNLIMTLNGVTDESQFSKLPVGAKVVLPVSNAAAAALAGGSSSVTGGNTTGGTNGSGLTTGTVIDLPTGDHVAYYLVTYTVQKGETIGTIYANMGLSYKTYQNQIVKLNNLKSINSVQAGQTLVLPTTSPGLANTTYTTIMAHTMRSGESAYNIICGSYALDYNSNLRKLQALNNRDNMGLFRIGETLYIPVPGVVNSNTNVNGGTGNNGGSNTSGSINNSGYFNLVSQNAENGSFDLQVSGKSVKTASAGQTVNVVCSPETGYAVDSIKVVKVGDAATAVTVSNSSFVMPSYSVTVSVTFKKAVQSDIKIDTPSNGSVAVMVNNQRVDKAYAGAQVEVKTTPATGFILDNVRVTYNDYRDTVAVENGKFTMPNFPVTVSASFKVDPDYKPSMGNNIYTDISNGKIVTKVGTTEVTRAKTGETVTIDVKPDENYTVESLTVYYDDFNKTAELDKNSFIMPAEPVTIVAVVKPTSQAVFAIKKIDNSEGTLKTYVDDKEVDTEKVGQKVVVKGTSSKAFYNYIITVTKTGDSSTVVYHGDAGEFTMPDYPVTVSAKFYIYHNVVLDTNNGTNGWYNVTAAINGQAVSRVGAGVELKVNIWGVKSGMSAGDIIVTYADGSKHTIVDGNSFIMPDCDIKVTVNFTQNGKIVANNPTVDGVVKANRGNSYTLIGNTLRDNENKPVTVNAGKGNNVTVVPSCAIGFKLDKISVSYTDKNGAHNDTVNKNPLTGNYQFTMPEATGDVQLNVSFKEIPSYKISLNYGENNKDLSMGSAVIMTALGAVESAAEDAVIDIRLYPANGYQIDKSKVKVSWTSEDGTASGNIDCSILSYYGILSFKMPKLADIKVSDYSVTVDVSNAFVDMNHKIALAPVDKAEDGLAKGIIKISVNDVIYDENTIGDQKFPEGTKITVISESRDGFALDKTEPILVMRSDSTKVPVTEVSDTRYTFRMPLDSVTVSASYSTATYGITKVESEHGSFTVPLQGNWRSAVEITDIVPELGYKLEGLYITYTSNMGEYRERVKLDGSMIGPFEGLPKSDVVVEAVFVPADNALTINYSYSGETSKESSYKVDLTYDEVKVDIARGTDKDTVAAIPTGKTVVVSRNTANMDTRFEISDVWGTLSDGKDTVPVTVEKKNGQFYFTMPFVEGKTFDLNVRFARVDNDSTYTLVSNIVNGTASHPQQVVKGADADVYITPAAGYELPESVEVKYTDIDGNTKTATVTGVAASDGATRYTVEKTLIGDNIDLSKPVTVTASCKAITYTINADGWGATVDGAPSAFAAKGQKVVATLPAVPAGMKYEGVAVKDGDGNTVAESAEMTVEFIMPASNVTLEVKASYLTGAIAADFDAASGEVVLTVNDAPAAVVKLGDTVKVSVTPAEDKVVDKVVLVDNDTAAKSEMTEKDGVYTATIPVGGHNYTVIVTFKAAEKAAKLNYKYNLADIDGEATDYFDIVEGEDGITFTPKADSTKNIEIKSVSYYPVVEAVASEGTEGDKAEAEPIKVEPTKNDDGSYVIKLEKAVATDNPIVIGAVEVAAKETNP